MNSYSPTVCVKCNVEMGTEVQGVSAIEMFQDPPRPYKIWMCDLRQCPSCGAQIVAGFGGRAIAEHFEDDFESVLERVRGGMCVEVFERVRI